MDVKFITTTRDNLADLNIVDGQVIALSDERGYFYDMGGSRYSVDGLQKVTNLPSSGSDDSLYLLDKGDFVVPYIWNTNKFVPLACEMITMTYAQYQALSQEEKMDGRPRFITDRG